MRTSSFRYASNRDYSVFADVSEFMDGQFQDVSLLTVRSGFGEVDGPAEELTLQSATWHIDSSTDPPTYSAVTQLGPSGHELTVGAWMMYVEVDGELYESGIIEVY